MTEFTHSSYAQLLDHITGLGRRIVSFENVPANAGEFVILRHDIDFSLRKALEMARIDHDKGVTATFFFLLTAPYYNPLSAEATHTIREIISLGHECGLHYDCTSFEELTEDQRIQKIKILADTLGNSVGVPVRSIAQHKPAKSHIKLTVPGMIDAYDPRYFNDIAYISDSRRVFRHEDVKGFFNANKKSQLLIHPIWWTKDPLSRSDVFAALRSELLEGDNANIEEEENALNVTK